MSLSWRDSMSRCLFFSSDKCVWVWKSISNTWVWVGCVCTVSLYFTLLNTLTSNKYVIYVCVSLFLAKRDVCFNYMYIGSRLFADSVFTYTEHCVMPCDVLYLATVWCIGCLCVNICNLVSINWGLMQAFKTFIIIKTLTIR